MWESSGFKESASDTVLVASDGSGGSRETRKSVRQVACGVATFSLQPRRDTSIVLLRTGFLGGLRYQADRRFQEPSYGELSRFLSRVDEQSNVQIPTDVKYVTRSIMHRVILATRTKWRLVVSLVPADRRARWEVTDAIKVKSHLEDVGPSVIMQSKIGFHHMRANSLADVVAEEAAKRLLSDLNLDREAKKAERNRSGQTFGAGASRHLGQTWCSRWHP